MDVPRLRQVEYQALTQMAKCCVDRRAARKARIILLAQEGWSSTMISREVNVSVPTVRTVLQLYVRLGRTGLFGKRLVELRAEEREHLTQLSQSRQADRRQRCHTKVLLDADQGI